jgi:hypothetical protein
MSNNQIIAKELETYKAAMPSAIQLQKHNYENRIARDPLDLASYLMQLLLVASEHDFEESLIILGRLSKIGLDPRALDRLGRISTGALPIHRFNTFFLVGEASESELEDISKVDELYAFMAVELGLPIPDTWISLVSGTAMGSSMTSELGGVRHVRLTRSMFGDTDMLSIACHELGHAFIIGESVVLNEGWAVWCQLKFFPDLTRTPVSLAYAGGKPQVTRAIVMTMLINTSVVDLTFESSAANSDDQMTTYVVAYQLVNRILLSVGLPVFQQLIGGAYSPSELMRKLDELGIFESQQSKASHNSIGDDMLLREYIAGRSIRDPSQFQETLSSLISSVNLFDQSLNRISLISRMLSLKIIHDAFRTGSALPFEIETLKRLHSLIQKISPLSYYDYLIQGYLINIETVLKPVKERAFLEEKAAPKFLAAIRVTEDNAEALIEFAKSSLYSDHLNAKQRTRALEALEIAGLNPMYQREARNYLMLWR